MARATCGGGYFNTNNPPVRIFNAFTNVKRENIDFPNFLYFDLTVWVSHDTTTEEEKTKYKIEIETCGGFLKTLEYKEAFMRAWDKASKEEHKNFLTCLTGTMIFSKRFLELMQKQKLQRRKKICNISYTNYGLCPICDRCLANGYCLWCKYQY